MVGLRTDASAVFTYVGIGVIYYLLAQQVQSLAVIITPNQARDDAPGPRHV